MMLVLWPRVLLDVQLRRGLMAAAVILLDVRRREEGC